MLPSMSMDTNVLAKSMSSALVSFASRARFHAFSSAITRPPSSFMLLCCAAVTPATNSNTAMDSKLFLTLFISGRPAEIPNRTHASVERNSSRLFVVMFATLLTGHALNLIFRNVPLLIRFSLAHVLLQDNGELQPRRGPAVLACAAPGSGGSSAHLSCGTSPVDLPMPRRVLSRPRHPWP